jgi:putative tryptophan/tyrosine transport system substrate-binding protein
MRLVGLAVVLVLSLTLAAPVAVVAPQAGRPPRVGFLTGPTGTGTTFFNAFRQGLQELGWNDGQNIALEYRISESEQIPKVAAELVRAQVDVILLTATAIRQARQATATVPVVFVIADDPVGAGFVSSLARPGGRMTGLTSLNVDLDAKRLEILKLALPSVARVGVLSTPLDPTSRERIAVAEQGARSLGLQLKIFEVPDADRLPGAFDQARRAGIEAIMVLGSPLLLAHQVRIVELAAKARLPVISAWQEFPNAGGLISYGTNVSVMFRRAAKYIDRILKGANPADLPVEQATTFELVINLKTAKALGLTIPQSLLLRADQIIE